MPITALVYLAKYGRLPKKFHDPTFVIGPFGATGRHKININGSGYADHLLGAVMNSVKWRGDIMVPADFVPMGVRPDTDTEKGTWICGRRGIIAGELDSPVLGKHQRNFLRMSLCERFKLEYCRDPTQGLPAVQWDRRRKKLLPKVGGVTNRWIGIKFLSI